MINRSCILHFEITRISKLNSHGDRVIVFSVKCIVDGDSNYQLTCNGLHCLKAIESQVNSTGVFFSCMLFQLFRIFEKFA